MKVIAHHKHLFLMLMMLIPYWNMPYGYAQEGFPYCEPLNDGRIPEKTVFGGHAKLVSDSYGNGVLQLTSNLREQNGYLYIDIPFPSSYGLKASFEYFSYGGEGNADGMVCFLFDAAVGTFNTGGFGGALGYVFNTSQQAPGLSGAYIGIGLDEYGNFTNAIEGKDGPGFRPDNISIRGPGDGFTGYQYIGSVRTNQVIEGLAEQDQFAISSGGMNTSRVTDSNKAGYRKVFIDLQPAPSGVGMILNLDVLVTTVDNEPRMVTIFQDFPYTYEAPENLKIGFAAATGEATNFHEIRNLVVEVSDDENLRLPTLEPINEVICEGDVLQLELTEENVFLPNEKSVVSCIQLYGSLEEIVEEEQDPCSVEKCNPLYKRLALEEGVFVADTVGGGLSFVPAAGMIEGEVAVYYTVTDNYGKTSKPEQLTVKVVRRPDAPVIVEESGQRSPDLIRLCEGEEQTLEVISAASGTYRWYKDGEEIVGKTGNVLRVNAAGIYRAWLFNEYDCATASQEVQIAYPLLPEVVVDELIVSCGEEFVDLMLFVEGYDGALYDYEVTAPDGEILEDGGLGSLHQEGTYTIRAKHKDLHCWSEMVTTEILMVPDPVEADFEYAVVMDDGSYELMEIFTNDPLQFTDLSLQQPSAWEWDFGDGNRSTLQHPRHAYTQEGNFMVSLTVYDQMGYCSSTMSLEVNVTRSYRIMYPTAFTPLGPDNRFFKPKTKGIKSMAMYIFNSWGDLLYVSDDISDEGWDGTNGGRIQPSGNYAYKVEFTTVLGEKGVASGRFALIK